MLSVDVIASMPTDTRMKDCLVSLSMRRLCVMDLLKKTCVRQVSLVISSSVDGGKFNIDEAPTYIK